MPEWIKVAFFAVLMVVGYFLGKVSVKDGVKVKAGKKERSGGFVWCPAAYICFFFALLGTAAFLGSAFYFAVLANRKWSPEDVPISTGAFVFAGAAIFYQVRWLGWLRPDSGKKRLSDDEADAWPERSGTNWTSFGGGP